MVFDGPGPVVSVIERVEDPAQPLDEMAKADPVNERPLKVAIREPVPG
jgi:hypothetical protein